MTALFLPSFVYYERIWLVCKYCIPISQVVSLSNSLIEQVRQNVSFILCTVMVDLLWYKMDQSSA